MPVGRDSLEGYLPAAARGFARARTSLIFKTEDNKDNQDKSQILRCLRFLLLNKDS